MINDFAILELLLTKKYYYLQDTRNADLYIIGLILNSVFISSVVGT